MELIGKKVKGVYFRTGGDHCRYPVVLIIGNFAVP